MTCGPWLQLVLLTRAKPNTACLAAERTDGDVRWTENAWRTFRWFLGENHLQSPLYDAATGGCRDGLHAERVNQNQGAESTLSFLLALLEMRAAERGGLESRVEEALHA